MYSYISDKKSLMLINIFFFKKANAENLDNRPYSESYC